jgi:hypothetical protein
MSQERVLFISHRHADKSIADTVRTFIDEFAPGRLKIYQSSDSERAPRVGRRLNDELRLQLKESGVVIWLYTASDQDWSYCNWECAIATDSEDDTNLVIFQFSDDVPAPFQELVRVNVSDPTDVRKFVNGFFTDPDFFPGKGEALSPGYQPNDERILRKADDLHESLQQASFPGKVSEWPAWAYLILEFQTEDIDRIKEETDQLKRVELTKDILTTRTEIVRGDKTAQGLFGARFPRDLEQVTFSDIFEEWRARYPDSDMRWLDSLCEQIALAARGFYPQTDWAVMRGAQANDWSIPVVNWIRTQPAGEMQFDVYFMPVRNVDERTGSLDLGVVEPQVNG